jgi:hypothetical protein
MNMHNPKLQNLAGLVSAICGSLVIGLPVIPLAASAVPASKVNPCPSIYYEEPYNSTRLVPQGCPPNATGRLLGVQRITTTPVLPPNSVIAPLPENRSNPIATVTPRDGKVDVKLINTTNAVISYEAIGYTQRRFLSGGEEIVLQNLPTPVTITTVRQDKGLVDVIAVPASKQGMLEVSLDESKQLDDNLGALRIQRDGQVFLN